MKSFGKLNLVLEGNGKVLENLILHVKAIEKCWKTKSYT